MALNPSLLRLITPPDAPFDLHLPAGTADAVRPAHSAPIPESKRNSWRYHRVAAGDTLASVAREYRVDGGGAGCGQSSARQRQPRGYRGAGGSGCPGPRAARRACCCTRCAGAIRWSPSPTVSASRSTSCGAGTGSPASGWSRAAACTWPSPSMNARTGGSHRRGASGGEWGKGA